VKVLERGSLYVVRAMGEVPEVFMDSGRELVRMG